MVLRATLVVALALARSVGALGGTAAKLGARLNPPAGTGPCTVLEVEQSTVPAAAVWFRLRAAGATGADPVPPGDVWFLRTPSRPAGQAPQGVQEFPFSSADVFNAGSVRDIVAMNLTETQLHSFVVEAWTDRNDLGDGANAALLATSDSMTYTFDDLGFSTSLEFDQFRATDLQPGLVTVAARPTNLTAFGMAQLVSWFGFEAAATTGVSAAGSTIGKLPAFTLSVNTLGAQYPTRLMPSPAVNVSYSSPGVYFLGIYGAWNGWYGFSDAKPQNGVRTHNSFPLDKSTGKQFQPFAVVVPFENGTTPALPAGFDGPVHTTPPIPGDFRLAVQVTGITVFDGGFVAIPLEHGPANTNGWMESPTFVEVELPDGVTLAPQTTGFRGEYNVSDVTADPGGGPVTQGYRRLRLIKPAHQEWAYENAAVILKTMVTNKSLEGRSFPRARIRAYFDGNHARADNWQPMAITIKPLKPLATMPKRLHTSFCWSDPFPFIDEPNAGYSSVNTWRKLGYNVVPQNGVSYDTAPFTSLLAPANRTGPDWRQMAFGIMASPFGQSGYSAPPYGMGTFASLKKPVSEADNMGPTGFNFTRAALANGKAPLTPAEEIAERTKWRNALQFYNETKVLDVSYNGWFYQQDVDGVAKIVDWSKPDFFSMDVEALPSFESWASVGHRSANFQARLLPNETHSQAALRIAEGWIGGLVSAVNHTQPNIRSFFYGMNANYDKGAGVTTWPMARRLGLAASPSYYGFENGLDKLAWSVRKQRLSIGPGVGLIPWLTPGEGGGTGGPQTANPGGAAFNELLQLFANGATGFNVFSTLGMYDMSIWLGWRDAIELAAAHEDIIVDGAPVAEGVISDVASAGVVSAMQAVDGSAIVIASSTEPMQQPTGFTIKADKSTSSWKVCDVRTLKSASASGDGSVTWHSDSESGSWLIFSEKTPCHSHGLERPREAHHTTTRSV